jgi:hypothetical protein
VVQRLSQNDVCGFESSQPSQAVRSLRCDFLMCENRSHSDLFSPNSNCRAERRGFEVWDNVDPAIESIGISRLLPFVTYVGLLSAAI